MHKVGDGLSSRHGVGVACWHLASSHHFYIIFLHFQQIPIVFDCSEYYNTLQQLTPRYIKFKIIIGVPAMTALEELIDSLVNFTPEQLEKFLTDPVTVSILQPEEASGSCPPVAS